MRISQLAILGLLLLLFAHPAQAQSDGVAEQRAALARQRIETEAERQANEEKARQETIAAEARVQAETETRAARGRVAEQLSTGVESQARQPATATSSAANDDKPDMSRMLEQLKTLGELRSAGMLTEDEFQRIKTRILDENL